MNLLVLAAAGAGVCFSMLSIFGRVGVPRKIHLLHLSAVVGILGGLWLLPGAIRDVRGAGAMAPAFLVVLGLANGAIRYLNTMLWYKALVMGPLSLLACALNLGFIMTIPYVWLVHGQPSTFFHWAAVALAIAVVLLAAKSNAANREAALTESRKVGLAYLAVLLGIWVLGGVGNIIIKEMDILHHSPSQSYLEAYGNLFWMCEYLSLGVLSAVDRLVARSRPGRPFLALGMGLAGVAAAVIGFEFIRLAIPLHPAIFFSIFSVTAIVFSAVVGAAIFRERRTLWWYLTIAVSVAVVLLANSGV